MKTEDIVSIFSAGRIEVVVNTDTDKMKTLIADLSKEGTVADLLGVLTQHADAVPFLKRVGAEVTTRRSALYPPMLRTLNAATPASDPKDVLL
jgi:hypothetical protein